MHAPSDALSDEIPCLSGINTFKTTYITSRTSTSTLIIWRNMTRLAACYVVAIFNVVWH